MSEEWIYEHITRLHTPVGYYMVTDGEKEIPFSVEKNGFDLPYHIYDEAENIIGEIQTETNYNIVIDSKLLETGREYRISFSEGEWEYFGADEHTSCVGTVINDWVAGIGSYDPNDDEKLDQAFSVSRKQGLNYIQMPDEYEYDESRFVGYSAWEPDNMNGFLFRLFDHTRKKIYFSVAWVRIGNYMQEEYESAIDYWLT